jgi:hypothetical protein
VALANVPIAIEACPLAVATVVVPAPMAIELAPAADTPPDEVDVTPPAAYCACATLPTPALAVTTAASTAFAITDLFGFPRVVEISDAATHAPSASFQMVLYVLFIFITSSEHGLQHRMGLRNVLYTWEYFLYTVSLTFRISVVNDKFVLQPRQRCNICGRKSSNL